MRDRHVWPAGVYFFYYHDVSSNNIVPGYVRTSLKRFETEVEYIKSHFEIIRFCSAVEYLKTKSIDKRYATLCFDDGYTGAVENALPLLELNGIPAILFLSGSFVRQQRVSEAVSVDFITRNWSSEKIVKVFPGYNKMESFRSFAKKGSSFRQFELFQDILGEKLLKEKVFANEKMIKNLNSDIFTLGNHTVNHLWLPNLTASETEMEIRANHEYLSTFQGYENFLAIPYGSNDSFNLTTLLFIHDYSSDVLIKAVGGVKHKTEGDILFIERIGLSDRKPPISLLIHERLRGLSVYNRAVRFGYNYMLKAARKLLNQPAL
jgi:peptidoglycan/xylan/chitin deacetylase (PgdA/CDA1 family)